MELTSRHKDYIIAAYEATGGKSRDFYVQHIGHLLDMNPVEAFEVILDLSRSGLIEVAEDRSRAHFTDAGQNMMVKVRRRRKFARVLRPSKRELLFLLIGLALGAGGLCLAVQSKLLTL